MRGNAGKGDCKLQRNRNTAEAEESHTRDDFTIPNTHFTTQLVPKQKSQKKMSTWTLTLINSIILKIPHEKIKYNIQHM